jgi:CheY-like chemotaxis protein
VRSAGNGTEGLRLYGLCAPFDVVLIDYCVPQTDAVEIDYCAPQNDGIELAMTIRKINPSQKMIIAAFDYQHENDVPRPTELMQTPILINTWQLRKLLEKHQYWANKRRN